MVSNSAGRDLEIDQYIDVFKTMVEINKLFPLSINTKIIIGAKQV